MNLKIPDSFKKSARFSVTFATHNVLKYYFNMTIESVFTLRTDKFEEIINRADFWEFMKTEFLDSLHIFLFKWEKKSVPVDFSANNNNFVLGPPRIRQIRIKPTQCRGNTFYTKHFPECYGSYSHKDEVKRDIFKGVKYYTPEEAGSYTNIPLIFNYHAGGYIVNLDFDKEKSEEIIEKLEKSDWIDRGTRMVVVEMGFFNGNLKFYCEVKYVKYISRCS